MTMNAPMNEIDDLILLSKNANALMLGSTAKEGGDIRVYRDSSGNIALSFDADATNSSVGLDLYAGLLVRSYLSVGTSTLSTSYPFYVSGNAGISGYLYVSGSGISGVSNVNLLNINIPVTDGTDHAVALRIDYNDIIVAKATGNGSGGITNKAIGFYGTAPATQAAHIADPAESTSGNNAAIDAILVALENIGILAAP